MKKLVSLLLAALMLLSLSPMAIAEGHEVTFVFTKAGFEPESEDNSIHQFINETTGITMNHIAPSGANYDEQISIMLASGANDIDMFKLSNAQFNKMYDYGDQGALLDLAPYLEEYMPHVLEVIPQTVLDNMKVDGHLYGIPVYCSPNRMNWMVRQDWLNNLNLQAPTTLDELHDVLYAFTNNDPDQNGVNDTVGMTGRGLDGLEPIFGAFGFTGVNYSYWYLNSEGKLVPSALHENAPEALKLIKAWYSEKLIDPEIFVLTTEDEIKDKAYNNYWGFYYNWWTFDSKLEKTINEYDPDFDLQPIAPPMGADGTSAVRGVSSTNGVICVMENSKNWEDCLRLIDWYHTDEGMMTTYSGVPNVHWYQDTDGKYYTTPQFDVDANWIQWYSAFESEKPLLMVETYMVQSRRDAFNWNTIQDAADDLTTTAEVKYEADLLDYVKEMYMKFVTGEADIDTQWDDFVKNWYAKGGQEWSDELNQVYQARQANK